MKTKKLSKVQAAVVAQLDSPLAFIASHVSYYTSGMQYRVCNPVDGDKPGGLKMTEATQQVLLRDGVIRHFALTEEQIAEYRRRLDNDRERVKPYGYILASRASQ